MALKFVALKFVALKIVWQKLHATNRGNRRANQLLSG